MGSFLLYVISTVLTLLIWAIIINAIMSWLIAFNVINLRNGFVYNLQRLLDAVTEPVLAPFRRVIPPLGTIDISPIVAIIVLQGVQIYLLPWLFRPIIDLLGG